MKLGSANTVKDFKEIVAKGEGLRKNLAGAGMCHLTEKPALQFIFFLPGFSLCTYKCRQLSWSASHISEQATLRESLFFFYTHG